MPIHRLYLRLFRQDERINCIFVSKQFDVLKHGVLTDAKDQRYLSDHQPVVLKPVLN